MLMSMTGFGKAIAEAGAKKICVEIKSLNSKQMDLNVRMPYSFREHELQLRAFVGHAVERGKVDLTVSVESNAGTADTPSARLNVPALECYKQQIKEAAETLGIGEPTDWYSVLLRFPDAISTATPELADDNEAAALEKAAADAVEALRAHRRAEGLELEKFFASRIADISELLRHIEPFEQERVPKIRQRIEENLGKLNLPDYDKGHLL